jgi:hypothetical protein
MANLVSRILKHAAYRSPFARLVAPRYIYNFRPAQLCFLTDCVDRTRDLPGPMLEIGCFSGATTVWLNMHMRASGIRKPYVALDTFEGFVQSDVEYELAAGGNPAAGGGCLL